MPIGVGYLGIALQKRVVEKGALQNRVPEGFLSSIINVVPPLSGFELFWDGFLHE